jgi:hypothetical protein
MPYRSGIHQWKAPLELSALLHKHKIPTWTLKDGMSGIKD